jgi:hypothetical protein
MSDASFSAALLDPERPVPEGLVTPDGAPATRRYAIYRNNVTVGLTEALEAGFPVIRKIVGERFFQAMAVVFVRNHPPTSPILAGYGAEMPGFLRGFEPVAHLKYLPDVARLELALRRAYLAGDAAPIAAEALGAFPPDCLMRARFGFAPAVQLLSSRFPIHDIWTFNMAPGAPRPSGQQQDILITWPDLTPIPTLLDRAGAEFTAALLAGKSFGAAIAAGGSSLNLSGNLGLLLGQAAITSIDEGTV